MRLMPCVHRATVFMNEKKEMDAASGWKKVFQSDIAVIGGSIILAGLIVAGSVVYIMDRGRAISNPNNAAAPEVTASTSASGLDIGSSPVLGDVKAPHTIVEFGDFQCLYCTKFHTDMDAQIRADFIQTGKAKMVFKTLAFIGPESLAAGLASECAKEQGKFWDFHDAIYQAEQAEQTAGKQPENSGNLTRDFFIQTAQKLGMNVSGFSACYDGKNGQAALTQYANDAQAAGVRGTPTVFVDGALLQNPFDVAGYQAIIK